MKVRKVRAADAPRVAALLGQLGYPAKPEQVRLRLALLDASTSDVTWVAEVGDRVVGLVGLHVSLSLEQEGPVAKVSELVVDERFRRQGAGAALLSEAEEEARRRGCVLVFLTTAERRQEAHAFYRSLGFEETGRRFAKSLD